MPARNKKGKDINLLPVDKFAASALGRVLAWLLRTFRIIVMAVELVVMIAFLSRFWLDAQNSDLKDEIKQKQALIEAQSDFEKEFINLQNKINIYSQIEKNKYSTTSDIKTIAQNTPAEVFLISIVSSPADIQIKGFSPFERSISQLIVNLESSSSYENVELASVDTQGEDSNLLEFGIRATRKGANAGQLEK